MSRRTRKRRIERERIERELAASRNQYKAVVIALQEKLNESSSKVLFQERRIETLEERVDKLMTDKQELQREIARLAWEFSQKASNHDVVISGINKAVVKLQERPKGFTARLKEMLGAKKLG